MRILVVEDDQNVQNFLTKGLEEEHYSVDAVETGKEAQELAQVCDYDLVVLDLNLPDFDGSAVVTSLRQSKRNMPILVLSGRSRPEERVSLLDLGADDYLVKPFLFSELSARARALMRRGAGKSESGLQFEDLKLSRVERTAHRGNKRLVLTSKEFALLEYLLMNAGRPVTRTMILEHVWNLSFDSMTNVVDVYINYLRKKVDETCEKKLIHTVRGVGYQLGGAASV